MNSLLINTQNGVTTLTLNRVERHNAFDAELVTAIDRELIKYADDNTTRILVIKANGKFFCAGGDLTWFKSKTNNVSDSTQLAQMLKHLYEFPKPTIAVAQGSAFGGGVGLLACCDLVVADENANFCLSEVKLGLVPATISPYIVQAVGKRQANYLALTAEQITAEHAQTMGLVQLVVETSLLESTTHNIIEKLLRNGPDAMRMTKQLLQELAPLPENYLEKTAHILASVRASEEAQEGIQAFLDKRAAQW
ncbi:MAG: enoyl-CoA hydratase-related protein [Pseudomonadota bacterium]|nr:enoyl-CoA hydratase-related protein [Pseudomonadota bacterium]